MAKWGQGSQVLRGKRYTAVSFDTIYRAAAKSADQWRDKGYSAFIDEVYRGTGKNKKFMGYKVFARKNR